MTKNTQKDTNSDEEVIQLSEILGTKDKNDEEESPLNDKQKVLYAIAIASFVAFIVQSLTELVTECARKKP